MWWIAEELYINLLCCSITCCWPSQKQQNSQWNLPKNVTAQQLIAPNGQLMIALVNPLAATPQHDPRWNEPSAVSQDAGV
eukprot:37892-Amphidinium_carterae.1